MLVSVDTVLSRVISDAAVVIGVGLLVMAAIDWAFYTHFVYSLGWP